MIADAANGQQSPRHAFLNILRWSFGWIPRLFRFLLTKDTLERIKYGTQILVMLGVPLIGGLEFKRYEARMHQTAEQSQIVARIVEQKDDSGKDEEQIAFLSVLGDAALPILRNKLLASEKRLEISEHSEVPENDPTDIKRFMDLSYAIYSEDADTRLTHIENVIKSHPDVGMRRACLRTLEFVPNLHALPFLRKVLADRNQDGRVKAAALLSAITIQERFQVRQSFSVVDASDDNLFEGKSFDAISLNNSSIDNLNLRGTHFRGATLSSVTLKLVDLSDSNWAPTSHVPKSFYQEVFNITPGRLRTNFRKVTFQVTNPIENADFSETVWTNSSLEMLPSRRMGNDAEAQSTSISFVNSSMDVVTFDDLNLNNISFGGSTLTTVQFNNSTLRNLTFDKASSLTNVVFSGGFLDGVDFSGATLDHVAIKHCLLQNVTLLETKGTLAVTSDEFAAVQTLAKAQAPNLLVSRLPSQ